MGIKCKVCRKKAHDAGESIFAQTILKRTEIGDIYAPRKLEKEFYRTKCSKCTDKVKCEKCSERKRRWEKERREKEKRANETTTKAARSKFGGVLKNIVGGKALKSTNSNA